MSKIHDSGWQQQPRQEVFTQRMETLLILMGNCTSIGLKNNLLIVLGICTAATFVDFYIKISFLRRSLQRDCGWQALIFQVFCMALFSERDGERKEWKKKKRKRKKIIFTIKTNFVTLLYTLKLCLIPKETITPWRYIKHWLILKKEWLNPKFSRVWVWRKLGKSREKKVKLLTALRFLRE